MHGIIRERNYRGGSGTSHVDINHVMVCYSDGRTLTFVPEAGRENFSEDDMLELAKVFTRASSAAEWAGDAAG